MILESFSLECKVFNEMPKWDFSIDLAVSSSEVRGDEFKYGFVNMHLEFEAFVWGNFVSFDDCDVWATCREPCLASLSTEYDIFFPRYCIVFVEF